MPIVILFISLLVSGILCTLLCEQKSDIYADSACAYYIEHLKLENKPLNGYILEVPESLLEYSRDYLPLLYPKWQQIRSNYTRISGEIDRMETRYTNLVKLNELNKKPVKSERPKVYQAWLNKQNKELEDLKKAHEQIKKSVENYYATAQIRGVDSDAEMQSMVGGMIKLANVVLEEHGFANKSAQASNARKKNEIPATYDNEEAEAKIVSKEEMAGLNNLIDRLKGDVEKQSDVQGYQKRLLQLLTLIQKGKSIHISPPDRKGNTALHYACAAGDVEAVSWLVNHGANPRAKTDKGALPEDCLGKHNREQIIQLLRR